MDSERVQLSRTEQMTQILAMQGMFFYRHHPILAVRDLTGCQLAPHQRVGFRILWFLSTWHGVSTAFLNLSRRVSKTFLVSLFNNLSCLLYISRKMLPLGASGFRQGKRILGECERIIENRIGLSQEPKFFLKRSLIKRVGKTHQVIYRENDAWSISFVSGNEIRTIPTGSDPDRWRGEGATDIEIDEKKDLAREIQEKVINPMGYVPPDPTSPIPPPQSKLINMGTVEYSDDTFTQEIEEAEKSCMRVALGDLDRSALWAIPIRFDYEDTFYGPNKEGQRKYWSVPYHMDYKKMLADRDSGITDLDSWNAENKNIPILASGAFFPSVLIRNACDKKVNERIDCTNPDMHEYLVPLLKCDDPVVIGVDASQGGPAFFAMVAVRLGQLATKPWDSIKQQGKTSYNTIINAFQQQCRAWDAKTKIYEWLENYPNTLCIALDKRGGGSSIADELAFRPPEGKLPIVDPEDKDRYPKVKDGLEILRLLATTEVDNTEWAQFGKGQFENQLLYCPKNDILTGNTVLDETYRFLRLLTHQLVKIKKKPMGRAWKFYMSDGKPQDLFSAFIYAMGEVRRRVHKETNKKPVHTEFAYIRAGW